MEKILQGGNTKKVFPCQTDGAGGRCCGGLSVGAEGGVHSESSSLGTDLESTAPPPFFSWQGGGGGGTEGTHSPWSCNLQIYSPLFSWKQNNSLFKSSLIGEFLCLFDLFLPNYFSFLNNLKCIYICIRISDEITTQGSIFYATWLKV